MASTKMKQLQWTKIPPTNIGPTFWSTVKNEEAIQKELDLAELEHEFCSVDKKANSLPAYLYLKGLKKL